MYVPFFFLFFSRVNYKDYLGGFKENQTEARSREPEARRKKAESINSYYF